MPQSRGWRSARNGSLCAIPPLTWRSTRPSRAHPGCLVDEAEGERGPARAAAGEIVDLALEQLGVGHHHLLAVDRPQARGLEADPLDGARGLVELDGVAALEWLVEQDRERGEQVGEDALSGEADRDAADPEARDQRGDVDAEIVEDDDDREREQGDADQHADDGQRIAEGGFGRLLAGLAADQPRISSRAQNAPWSAKAMVKTMSMRCWKRGWRLGIAGDDVDRRHDHEQNRGLGEDPADDAAPAEMPCGVSRATIRSPAIRASIIKATMAAETAAPIRTPTRLASSHSRTLWVGRRGSSFGAIGAVCGAAGRGNQAVALASAVAASVCAAASAAREEFEQRNLGARQALAPARPLHAVERIAQIFLHRVEQPGMNIGLAADRRRVAERFGDRLDHRLHRDPRMLRLLQQLSHAITLALQVRKCLAVKSPPVASLI